MKANDQFAACLAFAHSLKKVIQVLWDFLIWPEYTLSEV